MEEDQSQRDESTTTETLTSEQQCILQRLRLYELSYMLSESESQEEKPQGLIRHAIGYWKSLDKTEKKSFLSVNTSDLDYFLRKYPNIPWLRDLFEDVVTFYELYYFWDVYICPSPECRRWFFSGDLLISHLACEHLPEIHQTNAWPLRCDLTEENWCAETIRNTVWKPIDVKRTFCFLYDACGGTHDGGGLLNDLPLSEDSRRSELLEKLGKGFQKLVEHQEKSFFSVLSNGRLRALIHLAAKHILDLTSSISLACPFRSLLEQSPICFCFLEEEPLSCFVQLVDDMVHFVNQVTVAPPNEIMNFSLDYECDVNWSENGECLDALSVPQRNGSRCYFELNEDEIKWQLNDPDGLPRWLFEAPRIPSIELPPAKASKMFHQVESKVKSFVKRLTIPNMQSAPAEVVYFELWSAMCGLKNRTSESLVDSPPSSLSTEESNLWNGEQVCGPLNCSFFSCSTPEELVQFRRTAFRSKIKPGYLELIKLSFELQCLKPQIQELCTLDIRKCILPLIRSYLRMKLYALVNVHYQPVEDTDVEESTEKGCTEWTEEEELTPNDSSDETTEVVNTEAALPMSRTGVTMAIAESGGETGLETPTDSGARFKLGAQVFDNCRALSVSNIEYEDELASVPSWVEYRANRSLYLFLRESGLLEIEVTGLLVWGSITDVIKHCAQKDCRFDAVNIWECKTYKSLKCWRCCFCDSVFPYRERHMEHMECEHHQLGFPHNAYWLMPVPHKQDEVKGELGSETEKEALSGSTVTLDGSITFDRNYNCFLVDTAKLCLMPSCNNGEEVCQYTSRIDKVRHIKDQLSSLSHLFGEKYKLLRVLDFLPPVFHSAFSRLKLKVDTEIVQCRARIDNLKRDLSECCLSEYNISSPIGSFIQAAFGVESVNQIASSARQRFEALLHTVTCSNLPSINLELQSPGKSGRPKEIKGLISQHCSAELQSPGKVLIKIKEHGRRFGFAYVGMSWKFNGEMWYKGTKRTVNGSLQMVASTNWESDYFITDANMTFNVCGVDVVVESYKCLVLGSIRLDVINKLCEFEAEFARS